MKEFLTKMMSLISSSFDSSRIVKSIELITTEIDLGNKKINQIYNSDYMKKEKLSRILNSMSTDFQHMKVWLNHYDQKM